MLFLHCGTFFSREHVSVQQNVHQNPEQLMVTVQVVLEFVVLSVFQLVDLQWQKIALMFKIHLILHLTQWPQPQLVPTLWPLWAQVLISQCGDYENLLLLISSKNYVKSTCLLLTCTLVTSLVKTLISQNFFK